MSKKSLDTVLQYLRRVALTGHGGASDAHLLESFARQRDEAAFERLVCIHGPMVLGLCRRLLRHEQDAEDAFQATFLTLARKAGTISNRESLGSWLYKVAYRVACWTRGGELTNRMGVLDRAGAKGEADVAASSLHAVLDEEIAGLTDAYRRPIVLCYLQGKTHEEAARLLGCPKGTVASRLARAKDQLRRRLSRRSWALSTGVLASILTDQALAVPVPAGLVGSTLAYVSGNPAHAGALSAKVLALSEGVLRMMWLNKMKLVVGVVMGLVLAGAGVGVVVRHTWAGAGQDTVEKVQNNQPDQKQKAGLKPLASGDPTAQIADLRKEIAGLRKEIKDLQDALRQNVAPQKQGLLYQGKSVSFWLNQYKDTDPKFRAEAMEALGNLARKDKELIPVLVTFLYDEQVLGRGDALRYFGKEVVPLLVGVMKDKSSLFARVNAARVLGEIAREAKVGTEIKAAVPLLAQGLREENWDLRHAYVNALVSIGPDAKPAIPALIDLLGQSILAFKTGGEKATWWKEPRKEQEGSGPGRILAALETIDPDITSLLPSDLESISKTPRWDDLVSQWQQAYKVLRAKYQKGEMKIIGIQAGDDRAKLEAD